MTPQFDRASLREALGELAAALQARGQRARIYVAGGAAMLLAHSADRLTRDIGSAIEEGYGAVMGAAREIARRRGWPTTWINEAATPYMPRPGDRRGTPVFDHPHLRVIAAGSDQMLAMKARAARALDAPDLDLLLAAGGHTTIRQVADVMESVFPGEPLTERQTRWVREALRRQGRA